MRTFYLVLLSWAIATVAALSASLVSISASSGTTSAQTNNLAMTACTNGVRYSGFVVNNGPGVVWVNRDGSSTTNGHVLTPGSVYTISAPLRVAGEWFGVDNVPVYLYATNSCAWTAEQSLVRE